MKPKTAELLKKYIDENRVQYAPEGNNVRVTYDLTDEELAEIVEVEYGSTQFDKEELFQAILKKVAKAVIENAKADR